MCYCFSVGHLACPKEEPELRIPPECCFEGGGDYWE